MAIRQNTAAFRAISSCMHDDTPLARIALPDDDLIEKIDKELSKGKAAALQAAPEPKQQDAAVII